MLHRVVWWKFTDVSKMFALMMEALLTTDTTAGVGPRQRIFLLAPASRPALETIQSPVQWVPGVLSPGVKRGRGVTLTTHPHLVPTSRTRRKYASSPPKRLHGV
jgi:hypothetical protein